MAAHTARSIPPRLARWPDGLPILIKASAFICALANLVFVDLCRLLGFKVLRLWILNTRVSSRRRDYDALDLVRPAVRDASVFYWKRVHCLQRSAVVTLMLRRRGVPATLVIGYQPSPVQWHAWVE